MSDRKSHAGSNVIGSMIRRRIPARTLERMARPGLWLMADGLWSRERRAFGRHPSAMSHQPSAISNANSDYDKRPLLHREASMKRLRLLPAVALVVLMLTILTAP